MIGNMVHRLGDRKNSDCLVKNLIERTGRLKMQHVKSAKRTERIWVEVICCLTPSLKRMDNMMTRLRRNPKTAMMLAAQPMTVESAIEKTMVWLSLNTLKQVSHVALSFQQGREVFSMVDNLPHCSMY